MDTKDILKTTDSTRRLIQDPDYYKYIFKKTERIVSVVFYILYNTESNKKSSVHIEDIESAARHVHNAILASLQTRAHVAEESVREAAHALISLESKLNVAQVSHVIAPDALHVLASEIDAVLRGMNKYLNEDNGMNDIATSFTESETVKQSQTARQQNVTIKSTAQQSSAHNIFDRRERIKTVLEAKGQASIKDISEIITDCSEKTIQRELNAMIEDNIVKRHGERRWSTYTIF